MVAIILLQSTLFLLILMRAYGSCGYDGTLDSTLYSGLTYPNRTTPTFDQSLCLSVCAIDESCASVFYDKVGRQCHTSALPMVYNNPEVWNMSQGSARVKNNMVERRDVLTIDDTLAQGNGDNVHLEGIVETIVNPKWFIVDGDTSYPYYFKSQNFSPAQGKGVRIDLGKPKKVTGVSVVTCHDGGQYDNFEFGHIAIAINYDGAMAVGHGQLCNTINTPVPLSGGIVFGPNYDTYFPCDSVADGPKLGLGLPSQTSYITGRYVTFIYTAEAAANKMCLYQIKVYGFE